MTNAYRKSIWSWALYDWANSAFATVVMAGFFPIFFKQFWSAGVPVTESTYQLGMINSMASLVVAMLSPILGAVADQLGRRKGLLLLFACFGVVMTGGLFWVEKGDWQVAAALYVCAVIGFSGANLFYDALLPIISPSCWLDRVSALGFALGYLGGGLIFAVNVWMTLKPETFGLVDSAAAVQLAFLLTALWWFVFSVPLWLFVKEANQPISTPLQSMTEGFKQLHQTLRKIHRLPQTYRFLLAYWLTVKKVLK